MTKMSTRRIKTLESKIENVQNELQGIGPMRPGSLNQQYKDRATQSGPFWQLNYTHKMKTHTEYVRPALLDQIRAEITEYKRFRELIEKWTELAIQLSILRVTEAKKSL